MARPKHSHEFNKLHQDHPSAEESDIEKCHNEMTGCRYTDDEIVEESGALHQRQNASARNVGKNMDHKAERDDHAEGEEEFASSEVEYATNREEITTVWDSEEDDEQDMQESISDLYYNMKSVEELDDLLIAEPYKYKVCEMHYSEPNEAKCKVLENSTDDNIRQIEVRGRRNCGPTFEGDVVVVEVKSTEVLDTKIKGIKTKFKPSDQPSVKTDLRLGDVQLKTESKRVIQGIVTGIMHKKLNRKAHIFLCHVDRYRNYLMKPLDGVAPKIHVMKTSENSNSVAIYEMQDKTLIYKMSVRLDPWDRNEMLFVVRYLTWEPKYMYPLGYVTQVIPPGNTIEQNQQIINILHQVPTKPNSSCEEAAEAIDATIPEDPTRRDCRKLLVISVDPAICRDVDNAISIERINEYEFHVGIHIADVSSYVEKNDVIDHKARNKTMSYYGNGKKCSMVPRRFSQDLCSLKEGQVRKAISIFFRGDMKFGVLGKPEVCKSVIRNSRQLTYEDAEEYIDAIERAPLEWREKDLGSAVRHLYMVAVQLRANRIRDGQFFYESNEPFDDDYPFESHRMIEEFMIFTNSTIATYLESKYPGCIPLRVHKPPNEEDLIEWKEKHRRLVPKSFCFSKFQQLLETSSGSCAVTMLISTVNALVNAMETNRWKKMRTLIGFESYHPLHFLAMVEWHGIQEKTRYSCSSNLTRIGAQGDCKDVVVEEETNESSHFCLQLKHYVHFTSPIRRFMSVVIHRFVKAALVDDPTPPYTSVEVEAICNRINLSGFVAKKYHEASEQLSSTEQYQDPFRIPFIVEDFDDYSIILISSYLPRMTLGRRTIPYSDLLVNKSPKFGSNGSLILQWKRRFYDVECDSLPVTVARTRQQTREVLELDSERHSMEINSATWDSLQSAVKNRDNEKLKLEIRRMVDEDRVRKQGLLGKRSELTSEMTQGEPLVNHHVKFKLELRRGTVFQIQVGLELLNGSLKQVFHLLQLTEEKDICLQHNRRPVKCFAETASESIATHYDSVEHYKRVWLPIITMEEATQTAAAGDAIFCSNVPVWFTKSNDRYYGTLKIPLDFCRKRQIKIYRNDDENDESNDYICIRYCPPTSSSISGGYSCHEMQNNRVWVAHGVSTTSKIEERNDGDVVYLEFEVRHLNGTVPTELLEGEAKVKLCGVEFLTKSLPVRRMEQAVRAVDTASELCRSIALKWKIPRDEDIIAPQSTNYDLEKRIASIPRNNPSQRKAIRSALENPFTVIQGPPGTGKTVTGVKLICWFFKANKLLPDKGEGRPQILYCGPTNSAVDVAAGLLKKCIGHEKLKMVRVYSEMLEKQIYPIPRDATHISAQKDQLYDLRNDNEHSDIALHQLIRQRHNSCSKRILEYDEKFRQNSDSPENISDEEVEEYLKLVTTASIEELQKYDVIFCTCAASASKIIKKGAKNIRQIIIDDCGMCMEPQSLIPLVCHGKAQQIVLIGDHKQLQPSVMNRTASDLGMEKSLLERYGDQAIMLNEQYRMHPSICEFPSRAFYDSRLQNAHELRNRNWQLRRIWPNRSHPCIVFIHVEGVEKLLSVITEDGYRHLIGLINEAERDEVTRIFSKLVKVHQVKEDSIAILSQYRAQCSEIGRSLKASEFKNPVVKRVVASHGGEWNYVILSLVCSLPQDKIEAEPSEGWKMMNMDVAVDQHQINVALTRAKIGLIIIGNQNLLRCDNMWRDLLDHYQEKRCVLNVNEFLPDKPPEIAEQIEA